MFHDAGTLAAAIAVVVALMGSGIGVAFFVGRNGAKRGDSQQNRLSHLHGAEPTSAGV